MKNIIGYKLSGNLLIILLTLLVILHLLIILKVVPYEIVFGGQITDANSMLKFEITAAVVSLVFLVTILLKMKYLKPGKLKKAVNIFTWIVFFYFILNTGLNLISSVTLEKLIFTPVTVMLSVFTLRLAIEK